MTTKLLLPTAHDIIHQMIQLRLQHKQIQAQINALTPAFQAACDAQNIDKIQLEQATLSRQLTKGSWTYPRPILEAEHHLKQLKKDFQDTHEPTSGRALTWIIRLLNISETTP